jgi:ankyrin repeat protein
MGTRKNKKSNKLNKRFRKTQLKKQRGGSEESQEEKDQTLLYAIDEVNLSMFEKALNNGANVNVKNNEEETALIIISKKRKIVRGQHEFKPDHTTMVDMLLKNGAEVNERDNLENTALLLASARGHIEIVKLLLAKEGIDVNAKEYSWGNTAIDAATNNEHEDIKRLLLERNKPPIMSQTEYEKCIPGWDEKWFIPETKVKRPEGWPGDKKPTDVISIDNIEIADAVKFPEQPKECYNRTELKKWFKTQTDEGKDPINPLSRQPVTPDWIEANMGKSEQQIESAHETASLPVPPLPTTSTEPLPPPLTMADLAPDAPDDRGPPLTMADLGGNNSKRKTKRKIKRKTKRKMKRKMKRKTRKHK